MLSAAVNDCERDKGDGFLERETMKEEGSTERLVGSIEESWWCLSPEKMEQTQKQNTK